jgi:hypothetical protein
VRDGYLLASGLIPEEIARAARDAVWRQMEAGGLYQSKAQVRCACL